MTDDQTDRICVLLHDLCESLERIADALDRFIPDYTIDAGEVEQ